MKRRRHGSIGNQTIIATPRLSISIILQSIQYGLLVLALHELLDFGFSELQFVVYSHVVCGSLYCGGGSSGCVVVQSGLDADGCDVSR